MAETLIRVLDVATCVISLAALGATAYLLITLRKGKE